MTGDASRGWTATGARVLERAPELAAALRHHLTGPDHLVLALAAEEAGIAANALESLGATRAKVEEAIGAHLRPGEDAPARIPPLSPLGRTVVGAAEVHAAGAGRPPHSGDLLRAILERAPGFLAGALAGLGASRERLDPLLDGEEP